MPKKKKQVYIYLLHLSQPLGSDKHHSSHYCGGTNDIQRRLQEHRNGTAGARFTEVCKERGIELTLVRVWQAVDGYNGEYKIKRMKNHRRYCPICSNGKAMNLRGFTEVNLETLRPNLA